MGFESFTVVLTPCPDSPLRSGQNAASVAEIAADIRRHWPSVCPDDRERDEIALCPQPDDIFLFSETEAGLFQMLLQAGSEGSVDISLRFALCNPRTVYTPFCGMVAWLMRRHQLRCHSLFYVPSTNASVDFCGPDEVEQTLTPHMEENRRLWQLDASTEEEACLRPGDAFEQIYFPRMAAA